MKITNRLGLPVPLVTAIERTDHLMADADISVTQLIDSPQIRRLRGEHEHELVEDASERIWAILGQAVHIILERADQGSAFMAPMTIVWPLPDGCNPIRGDSPLITISGMPDHLAYTDGVLSDWKMMSVWEHIFGLKPSREQQLNLYKYLWERTRRERIEKLQAVGMFRDWSIGEYERKKQESATRGFPFDYPPEQVHVYDIPIWADHEVETFIDERLVRHFGQQQGCTLEEMWWKAGKFAVMKEGRKRAVRLFDTEEEAFEYCSRAGLLINGEFAAGYSVVMRIGSYDRCRLRGNGRSYCPVSKHCSQWAAVRQVHGLDLYGQICKEDT